MQGDDDYHYLDYNAKGVKDSNGCIYMSAGLDPDLVNNSNTMIYGHAKNPYAFAGLKYLNDAKRWYSDGNNHFIRIKTDNYYSIWQIFSWYESTDGGDFDRLSTDNWAEYFTYLQGLNEIPSLGKFEFKDEDKIIYEKNSEDTVSIASLTKIMTTLVSIENIKDLNEKVTITEKMLSSVPWDASVAGLQVGDVVTYEDLLYASMLPSGADATDSLAISLTGSISNFVEKMNDLAKKLNLTDLKFSNTTGYDAAGHYGTAKDILKLLEYALENPTFKKIYETKEYTLSNGLEVSSTINYYNKKYSYDLSFIKGSKTGYTENAGYCLSTESVIDGVNILTVTLNAPDDGKARNITDIDTIKDALNENMQKVNFVEENEVLKSLETKNAKEDYVKLRSPKTVTRYIEKPYDTSKLKIEYDGDQVIKSTVKKGTKVGTFKIYYDNKLIETFDATTSTDLHFSIWAYLKNNIKA